MILKDKLLKETFWEKLKQYYLERILQKLFVKFESPFLAYIETNKTIIPFCNTYRERTIENHLNCLFSIEEEDLLNTEGYKSLHKMCKKYDVKISFQENNDDLLGIDILPSIIIDLNKRYEESANCNFWEVVANSNSHPSNIISHNFSLNT